MKTRNDLTPNEILNLAKVFFDPLVQCSDHKKYRRSVEQIVHPKFKKINR